MAIGNGQLMHECFLKHLHMGIARIKYDKETDKNSKKRGVSVERSMAGKKKKRSRRSLTIESKYNNNKHNIVVFYKI